MTIEPTPPPPPKYSDLSNDEAKVIGHYLNIQGRLSQVFRAKIKQYGIGMYHGQTETFLYWAAYFNVRRKMLRLETLTETSLFKSISIQDQEAARNKLISDYKDLANYAIMAIQTLEEHDDEV